MEELEEEQSEEEGKHSTAAQAQRKLQLACLCSVLFMIAQVIGVFYAGSLSIMTDAALVMLQDS